MLSLSQYHQLQSAIRLLWECQLPQTLSHASLVCYLALLAQGPQRVDATSMAQQLGWSQERARHALEQLSQTRVKGRPLVCKVAGTRRHSGRFAPHRYQLNVASDASRSANDEVSVSASTTTRRNGATEETPLSALPSSVSTPTGNDKGQKHNESHGLRPIQPPANLPTVETADTLGYGQPPTSSTPSGSPGTAKPRVSIQQGATSQAAAKQASQQAQGREVHDDSHPASSDDQTGEERFGELEEQLRKVGVTPETIQHLLATYPPDRIERQLALLRHRQVRHPAGFLVKAVKEDWAAETPVQGQQHPRQESIKQTPTDSNPAAEALERYHQEQAQQQQREKRLRALEHSLSEEQKRRLRRHAERNVRKRLRIWPEGKSLPRTLLSAEYDALLEQQYGKPRDESSHHTSSRSESVSGDKPGSDESSQSTRTNL